MSNTLGIITAFALALSAFLAYKNKAAYERRITETQEEKTKLQRSTDRFNVAVKNVNDTSKALEETIAEANSLNKEATERKTANDDLRLQFETKTTTANANKAELDTAREMASQFSDQRELVNQMRQVRVENEELSQNISNAETKLANLISDNNQAESLATSIRTRLDTFTAGRSLPTVNTRIRSIYPSWGFVTLAAGNNGGIATGSTLHVTRDGQTIGKLLVTAVESNSASASIIPDSIPADTVLMVGDQVAAPPAQ